MFFLKDKITNYDFNENVSPCWSGVIYTLNMDDTDKILAIYDINEYSRVEGD